MQLGASSLGVSPESLKGIEKSVSRFVTEENKKVTSRVNLMQESLKEIRDYAKEEISKVRQEM